MERGIDDKMLVKLRLEVAKDIQTDVYCFGESALHITL